MKINHCIKAILCLTGTIVVLALPSITRATTLTTTTFDDLNPAALPGGDAPYEAPIPNGYNGLQWNNFWVMDVLTAIPSIGTNGAFFTGMVSQPNLALNRSGNPARISGGSFNLDSAYLTAAFYIGLQVEVQGFVGGTLTYDNTYTVNTTSATLVNFNYLGVDKVIFISSYSGVSSPGTQFLMDNMTISAVPEPATLALAGLGAAALMACRRRQR
jgi:hypothetical protein